MTVPLAQARPKKILLMVIKNISALDYTLPLLWALRRRDPQANVSVLYCTLSRRKILRRSGFYSEVLEGSGIREYDFADFLRLPYSLLTRLWRRMLSRSNWDSPRLRGVGSVLVKRIGSRIQRALSRLEGFLLHRVDYARILPGFDPDVVLFDNRSVTTFTGRDEFYAYFERTRKKIVLLPHAPHHTGTTAFTPFDERGRALPEYCDYWLPFEFDRTWESVPEQRSQFICVGYPGLDSEWLGWLRFNGLPAENGATGGSPARRRLRCLFIIRKFLPAGRNRPVGHDAYIFDHGEFTRYLRLVRKAIDLSGADIELVLKPHPSNDYPSVKRELRASGIGRWSITHESIYAEVPRCDLVIALYSTTLLIPAMAGKPVILLHSRIQDEIHQWEGMKRLYSGLRFYLADPQDLPETLARVAAMVRRREASGERATEGPDVQHLRAFFPDGALNRCLERLGAGSP